MKKGSKAVFTCPPEMAYGKEGKGNIPPNSTMVFEIEVIDFELVYKDYEL